MTYIWNRADKVDPKLMPDVVEDAFNQWTKEEQYKNFKYLSEERNIKSIIEFAFKWVRWHII